MKIYFYDVSNTQELAHLNGKKITHEELYKKHFSLRNECGCAPLNLEQYKALEFHPYGVGKDGWKKWTAYFSTATLLLSGHTPSHEEIKVIRKYIQFLPNDFKRSNVTQGFILNFVTYLFIGFKGHAQEGFYSESNAAKDLAEFTLSLFANERLLFSSFLCAHREPKIGDDLNLLQEYVPEDKIRRTAALLLALAHNIHDKTHGSVVFLQQGVSAAATSSIFPEVTIEYLENSRGHVLLERLQRHFDIVSKTISSIYGERVHARLVTLDVLTTRIERFLQCRYGDEWRYEDFTAYKYQEDLIAETAIHMTLPCVQRLMPFFSEGFQQSTLHRKKEIIKKNMTVAESVGGHVLAVNIEKMIEWFMLQHSMTISAKAMYETAFYYLWGKYVGSHKGAYAIGLDREHNRFQHFSLKRGSILENGKLVGNGIPALYARRNPTTSNDKDKLGNLSFRQFWR